jgi:hypothetical protein
MRQQHCASRNAMNSVHQALSGAPLSSDVPGLGSWDSVAGRWRSTEWYGTTAPERSLQAYARPVYLIEINILLFAFHVFAKLETAKASSDLPMKSAAGRHPKLENRKGPDERRRKRLKPLADVGNGSKADIASIKRDVRFTPKSGHC